jgi:TonB family protein
MFVGEGRRGFLLRCAYPLGAIALLLSLAFIGIASSQESARKLINKTSPSYPDLAKKMHLGGKVKLEVVVNAAGIVMSARFVGGKPVFETGSVEAVKQWKFEPAAVASKGIVTLEFVGD